MSDSKLNPCSSRYAFDGYASGVVQSSVSDAEFESFEWDEAKSDRTFEERGFDFEFASRVFDGDYIESEDVRQGYGEMRFVCVG